MGKDIISNSYSIDTVKEILKICGINIDSSLIQKILTYNGSINQNLL